MNNIFDRIDLCLKDEISVDDLEFKINYISPNNAFIQYTILNRDLVDRIVLNKIRFLTPPTGLNLTQISRPGASPHTDNYDVALNYYFNVGGDTTEFYETNYTPKKELDLKIPDNFNELKVIGELNASNHECYLLNTKILHRVKINNDEKRYILRYFWIGHSYQDILNSIQLIGK